MKTLNGFLIAACLVGPAACKARDAREAERAADRVAAKEAELDRDRKELGNDVKEGLQEVRKSSADLNDAAAEFETKRSVRVSHLEGQLAVLERSPSLLGLMEDSVELGATGRVKLDLTLATLRGQIADAQQQVAALRTTAAADFAKADEALVETLRKIDKTRDDAIGQIGRATVVDRPGA